MEGERSFTPFRAYCGDEPYIFASYAHADKDRVYPELLRLHNEGYRIWYDEGITPSRNWIKVIPEAIEGCSFFLLFVSQAVLDSIYVPREINEAVILKKPVLPVFIESTTLSKELGFQLNIYQHLHKHELRQEDYEDKLKEAIPEATRGAPPPNIPRKVDPLALLFEMARKLNSAGHHEGAIMLSRKLIELAPDKGELWMMLGILLHRTGDIDGAIEAFRKSIEITPDYSNAWYNLAGALRRSGDLIGAIEAYRKALEITPDNADAWLGLGSVLREDGDLDRAFEAFRKAIEVTPDNADAWLGLGLILGSRNDVERAMEALQKSIEINPDKTTTWHALGITHLKLNNLPDARNCFQKAISLDPSYADPFYFMACTLAIEGDVDGAIDHLQRAVKIDPEKKANAREDKIFDPIRDDPRFKKIVGEE